MTTVEHESGSGGGRRKRGKLFARGGGTNPWKRVWQVPLLIAGLVAFGLGVRTVVKSIKPVPFAVHVGDVKNIMAAGKYEEAIKRINVLGDYFKADAQQAVLQQLAGDAHYLAQQKEPNFVRENYQRVADHYRRALALGAKPDATMNERWGEAGLALGDAQLALEKLEAAIAADPLKLPPHARDLVAAHVANGELQKAQDLLAQTLKRPEISVDERSWALCKRIELALASNNPADIQEPPLTARARN